MSDNVDREVVYRASPGTARLAGKPEALGLLAPVALLDDLLDRGLLRGQAGTIVELLSPGVYEVEFSDSEGRAYATAALRAEQLLELHHEQVARPALPRS